MDSSGKEKSECILVVSEKPVFCEILKHLLEEAGWQKVVIASSKRSASRLAAELSSVAILLDQPDTRVEDLSHLFPRSDQTINIMVLGWNDNKLAIYRRRVIEPATCLSLVESIGGDFSDEARPS